MSPRQPRNAGDAPRVASSDTLLEQRVERLEEIIEKLVGTRPGFGAYFPKPEVSDGA